MVFLREKDNIWRLTYLLGIITLILKIRYILHGDNMDVHWTMMENEIAHMVDQKSRLLAVTYTHFIYVLKLLYPFRQSYDYGYACIEHVTTMTDYRFGFVILNYSIIGYLF